MTTHEGIQDYLHHILDTTNDPPSQRVLMAAIVRLDRLEKALAAAPVVAWTKPDGSTNRYLCLIESEWRTR